MAGISFMTMIKSFCMAGNILVQVSPYPQVKRWESRRDTGEADAAPYLSIAFGGWQWCYYGVFAFFLTRRHGFLILVHSNCLGAILGTYYSAAFYRNCQHDDALQGFYRYAIAAIALVMLQVCALFILPLERALFLTGLVSSLCSFFGAICMLVSLPVVLRTRDSQAICGPLVLANLVSSFFWCICGWMLEDPLIAAPNVVGMISSCICLYLKWLYPSNDSCQLKKELSFSRAIGLHRDSSRAQSLIVANTDVRTIPPPSSTAASPSTSASPTPALQTPSASEGKRASCDTGGTF